MPLQWLGQLKPTMEQILALQKALLALAKEDEGAKAKPTGALVRGLQPKAYAGPTPTLAEKEGGGKFTGTYPTGHFRPGAGGLEEALRAAKPSPGYEDPQAKAWARREEMAEERVVGAKEAYEQLLALGEEGRTIALNAIRRHKPEILTAMEREGYISPDGTLAEPEEVNKPFSRSTHVEDGWLYEDVLYDDGTSTHDIIGRAEEVEAEGATVAEIINAQKLGIDIEQHEERFYRDALKIAGDCPRIGIDMVVEDGEERPAEQKDVDAWKTNMNNTIKFLKESAGVVPGAEVPVSMEDIKSMYEGRPDLISDVQRQLGLAVTGVWDDPLEEALRTYGGVE